MHNRKSDAISGIAFLFSPQGDLFISFNPFMHFMQDASPYSGQNLRQSAEKNGYSCKFNV